MNTCACAAKYRQGEREENTDTEVNQISFFHFLSGLFGEEPGDSGQAGTIRQIDG